MTQPPKGLTTGITYPNVIAPEREVPEYDDTYKIPDNTPRAGQGVCKVDDRLSV